MKKSNFIKIRLEWNYPEESIENEDGDFIGWDYNSGSFGEAIVYLNNPEIYIITTIDPESDHIEDYLVDVIIPELKKHHGDGPYTINDLASKHIEKALTIQYQEDCRTAEAFVLVNLDYVNLTNENKIIKVSKKLEKLQINGISLVTLLKKMDGK
jgi:hypothetical protein